MAQTNINIRMDESLKKQAEALFKEFGMNMTTAINIFVKQTVRARKIPFEIGAEPRTPDGRIIREGVIIPKGEENDTFYSMENIRWVNESMKQIEEGNVVIKTMEELMEMEK